MTIHADRVIYAAGLKLVEPASVGELISLWSNMRPEERGEIEDYGGDFESWINSFGHSDRTVAVYHGSVLLAVASVTELEDGRRVLGYERTRYALARGHRFTWLKGYAELSKVLVLTERQRGASGEVYFVTPTNLPRALDVYRHARAEKVGEIEIRGRAYHLMRIKGA